MEWRSKRRTTGSMSAVSNALGREPSAAAEFRRSLHFESLEDRRMFAVARLCDVGNDTLTNALFSAD